MIKILLLPVIKKYRKLIISMIAVSSLGIALMVGLSGAYTTLDNSLNRYVNGYDYADIVITTELTDAVVKKDIAALQDVISVETRIAADIPVRLSEQRWVSLRAFSYGIRDYEETYVWQQNESAEYPNVAMEYKFAEENGICAGDLIEVKIDDSLKKVCVGSLISSPECLSVIRDNYSWGENADFGYIFVPENYAVGSELYGQCNQFVIRTETRADDATILTQAESVLREKGIEIKNSYDYPQSPVYKKIDINLKPIGTLSLLIPTLFFINMIIVVSLFLSQIIRQCRKEIGILRALGFKKVQIRLLYCAMTFLITIAASIIGIAVGYGLMRWVGGMYGDFFPLPQLFYTLDPAYTVLAAIITILAGQAATLLSTAQISRIMPSEAMSREAPAINRMPQRLGHILEKCSPGMKFSISSIFKNGKRFIFSTICVAVSLTLILVALSFDVSKNSILKQMYDLRTHYDAQIFVTDEPDSALLQGFADVEGVTNVEVINYRNTTAVFGDKTADVVICGLPKETALISICDKNEAQIAVPETGIVLERHTAEELGVSVGDSIKIDNAELQITAVSEQCVNRIQYVSVQTLKSLDKIDQYAILCNAKNETALLDYAVSQKSYAYMNFTRLMREGNEKTFSLYSLGVYILIGFAVLLGFLIVYNTIQANLFEQRKELSVLRALGFRISEISKMWFIQTILQFIISCVIGLLIGTGISKFALAQMATEGREYPFVSDPLPYILTAAIVFLYVLISHIAAMRSIGKWDIVENTKEKE